MKSRLFLLLRFRKRVIHRLYCFFQAAFYLFGGLLATFGRKLPSYLINRFAEYGCIFWQTLMEKHVSNLYIKSIIFLILIMKKCIKKRTKHFRPLEKSPSICSPVETQLKNSRYFYQESQNLINPISIKSFMKPHPEERRIKVPITFKTRCRSAVNEKIGRKNKKQRATAPLNQNQRQGQSSPAAKGKQQFQQFLKSKQALKKSNRIHQDRWRLLSSIQTKLIQQMQSNVFKRRLNKRESLDSQEKNQSLKAKSLVRFNDLIQIKQLQLEKESQKRQLKMKKLFATRISKKPSFLSRTQVSSESYSTIFRGVVFRDPYTLLNHSYGRLSVKEQELTGWDTSLDI